MICNPRPGKLIYSPREGDWWLDRSRMARIAFPNLPARVSFCYKETNKALRRRVRLGNRGNNRRRLRAACSVWGRENEATASQLSVCKHGHSTDFVESAVIGYQDSGPLANR